METTDIVKLMRDADLDVRSYSGRGMYGKSCVGVDTGMNAASVVLTVLYEATQQLETLDEVAELIEDLGNPLEDSLGMGTIVYWPHLEWVKDESDDADEDDEY